MIRSPARRAKGGLYNRKKLEYTYKSNRAIEDAETEERMEGACS